jgi:hypothetical protein
MEFSFPHYLLSKQSVDDRALNRTVLEALKANLPGAPLRIIEVGAGSGTMLTRLISWGIITRADYVLVEEMTENVESAKGWIQHWCREAGLSMESTGDDEIRVFDSTRDVHIWLECRDVFEYVRQKPRPSDLLIAHAFLDLLPMPESMPKLLSLTKGLAWLTINFDGVTSLEPTVDVALDEKIEHLYHATMDSRSTGGDSRSGRHLFDHLRACAAEVLAAGASDWVVHPINGGYPADEAYFLHSILHFFEESLTGRPELDALAFENWLKQRRAQVDRGELVYIAHQLDFLARVKK